jgi:hypothetical protein
VPEIVKNMVEFLYTTDYNDRRSACECDFDRKADELLAPSDISAPGPVVELLEEDVVVGFDQDKSSTENLAVNRLGYSSHPLIINAKTYIIADKKGIEALQKLASTKYECSNDLPFTDSARLVYENTMESDRTIKGVIVQVASDNIKALLDRGESIELLNYYGELATNIFKRVVAGNKPANGLDFVGSSEWGGSLYSKGKKKRSSLY